VVCRIVGRLDHAALQDAVNSLVIRHEAMRTTLVRQGRQLVQTVHEHRPFAMDITRSAVGVDSEGWLSGQLRLELTTPIPIEIWPIRARLWQVGPEEHYFCLNCHHAVSDAWSGWIQLCEIVALYDRTSGEPRPVLQRRHQFSEFATAEARYLTSEVAARDRAYWESVLGGIGFDAVPLRPADPQLPPVTTRFAAGLERDVYTELEEIARRRRSTIFAVMLSLYFASLLQVTGKGSLGVASMFANRNRPGHDSIVGYLANLLVIGVNIDADTPLSEIHARTSRAVQGAFVHQAYPLHLLSTRFTARDGRRADEAVFQMLPRAFTRQRFGPGELELVVPEALESRFPFEITMIPGDLPQLSATWDATRLDPAWVSKLLDEWLTQVRRLRAAPHLL
jgi:hypothetical protein